MPAARENQHVEWKESWRDEYLRWLCGFANAEGGVLVIGRNDRGEAVGVKNASRLLEELPNKIRDVLGIVVDVRLVHEGDKELIVEAYPSPISYKGEYHVRSGSTKQELKGAALDRFLLRKQGRARRPVGRGDCALPQAGRTQPAPRRGYAAGARCRAGGETEPAGRRLPEARRDPAVPCHAAALVHRRVGEGGLLPQRYRSRPP